MSWLWRSPQSGGTLTECGDELQGGDERFARNGGIWDLLTGSDRDDLVAWSDQYGRVRAAEGRTAPGPEYYRDLPWRDTTGRFADQWAIRAESFDRFLVLLGDRTGRLVDHGAGNGWAAARCVERGWEAMAIDVNVDGDDGLGAAHHHGVDITLVRSPLETIPLEDSGADAVLVNAALHYAAEPAAVAAEAMRVAGDDGLVVVADSPMFESAEAGRQMVREQDERLRATGVEPPPLPGPGFLCRTDIDSWTGDWADMTPSRGRLRALIGRRRAGRETARLCFLVGRGGNP